MESCKYMLFHNSSLLIYRLLDLSMHQITDPSVARFETPLHIDKPIIKPATPAYEVSYTESPFSLQIKRKGGPML